MLRLILKRNFSIIHSTRVNLKGEGSSINVQNLRNAYLNSPFMVDVEYSKHYTAMHK